MRHLQWLGAPLCALLMTGQALAQAQVPVVKSTTGGPQPAGAVICVDLNGAYAACGGTGAVTTSPLAAEATACSGTVTTGATAQSLFAAATIHGWQFYNLSATTLYLRSKGAAGTTVATPDQNSLPVPAGGYYEAPHVSAYGMSVYGATTGQAFYCRTW